MLIFHSRYYLTPPFIFGFWLCLVLAQLHSFLSYSCKEDSTVFFLGMSSKLMWFADWCIKLDFCNGKWGKTISLVQHSKDNSYHSPCDCVNHPSEEFWWELLDKVPKHLPLFWDGMLKRKESELHKQGSGSSPTFPLTVSRRVQFQKAQPPKFVFNVFSLPFNLYIQAPKADYSFKLH